MAPHRRHRRRRLPANPPLLPPLLACDVLGEEVTARNVDGPFGMLRHDLADDFSVTKLDGSPWTLSEQWSGCESYIFLPSGRVNSGLDDSSIWQRDVDGLIAGSPLNAHYFFVASRTIEEAPDEVSAMQQRVDAALAALPADESDWWRDRLHVVAQHRSEISGWLGDMLNGAGAIGFAIDRMQQIRLLGSFADVDRFSSMLQNQGQWPWEANLAYAAHEARHYNYEAQRERTLAAESDVTIVAPWSDEVLMEVVETSVTFPSPAEMAAFDTLEIDLWMDCADQSGAEFGNCGAWDYLSHIYLIDVDGMTPIEMARFITTYHREGRYLVDATPMLAHLRDGGARTIRFEVSPPWNPQAYRTRMHFRLANRNKSENVAASTPLFTGGSFNATYNDAYTPIDVPISAAAQRVEVWAIITGHGADLFNCAEFCDHQHEVTVNGSAYTKTHDTVGDNKGCIGEIENGMVPNQGGTWWFGRGGWCPGQQVEPWVVDVTADVTPGSMATVSYRGLLNGASPPDNAGNIRMTSWLVVYE